MTTNTLRIFLLVPIFSTWLNTGYSQESKLDSVKVEFEGFDTETVFDISCDAFDYSFTNTKKTKKFYKENDLSKFNALIKDLEPQAKQSFDVRGKIIYYYKKSHSKYCFNVFGDFYKDGQLFYNKKLLIYLTDKLYNSHPKYLDTLRQQ